MKPEKKSWMKSLFAYAEGENKRLVLSVVLSVLSVVLGLVPFYCMYQVICLFAAGAATAAAIVKWWAPWPSWRCSPKICARQNSPWRAWRDSRRCLNCPSPPSART